jgi:hypothetical protein
MQVAESGWQMGKTEREVRYSTAVVRGAIRSPVLYVVLYSSIPSRG